MYTLAYTSTTFYKVPEKHGHVCLVRLYFPNPAPACNKKPMDPALPPKCLNGQPATFFAFISNHQTYIGIACGEDEQI